MVMKIYKRSGMAMAICMISAFAILIYFYLIRTKTNPTASSSLNRPGKLIIDTDAGGDDAGAILLALAAEKHARKNGFEVLAITCVYGNTNLTSVESNVRKILTVANRGDVSVRDPRFDFCGLHQAVVSCDSQIPVYSGAQKPLIKSHTKGAAYGEDGLSDVEFEEQILSEIDRSKHASLRLIDLAREHKGNISVLALGPLTNVALAITLDPDFVHNVERFYVTGSRLDRVENNEVVAEFNFYQDPHSYFVVFNFTRELPVVSLPWETVLSAAIPKKWRTDVLGAMDSRAITFLNKIEAGSPEEPTWRAADMMITASILWPDLITRSRLTNVSPVYDGTARGAVSVDRSDGPGKIKNAVIIEALDVEGFKRVLLDAFS